MNTEVRPRLRIWPGIVIVALQWLVTLASGISPGTPAQGFMMVGGPAGGLLLLLIWWLAASRARWLERLIGLVLLLGSLAATFALAHPSMGIAIFVWGVPVVCAAFVAAVTLFRDAEAPRRRWVTVGAVLAACAIFLLLRAEGVRGDMNVDFALRSTPTAEDRLIEDSTTAGAARDVLAEAWTEAQWPEFRGARRDGVVEGVRIAADWSTAPPEEVWRKPIGPGWGSFSLAGGRLYTQEQRGEEEVVAAYDAATGEPLWMHGDKARFWEALAGPGPRATPTLHQGRVYAFGATGILNALDGTDGSLIWSRNAASDTGADIPDWGFASSPLVVDDLVIVHTGGGSGKSIVAYELGTGEPRWFAGIEGPSYSSAHLATLQGVRQIVFLAGAGATGLVPETGEILWEHAWSMGQGARIVQPAFTPDGDLLIGTGFGMGVQRVRLSLSADGWSTEQRWTSTGLKPYFNDFVTHKGHAYGFDGRVMSCIDLADGSRKWKGGRYGAGQALLLADQDLLIVLSETGDLALVEANPERFVEIARIPAIAGKTWNHPILVDGMLYVRNGDEMAAYRMAGWEPVLARDIR